MSPSLQEASEQASGHTRPGNGLRGPIVVAVGPSGSIAALIAGYTIACRAWNDLIVMSVVEPPPIYTFETNRALLLRFVSKV